MSDTIADQAAAAPVADSTPATPAAEPSSGGPIIGQEAATPAAPSTPEINPYEATFSQYFDADGKAVEGWTEKLNPDLGLDDGRKARLARQGSFDAIIKSLAHAQDTIEQRHGAGEFVPSPENENAFNEWRSSKGIPVDPLDPENGYDLRPSNLPEGEAFDEGLAKAVAPLLHKANVPKGVAKELSESFTAYQMEQAAAQAETFQKEQEEYERATYDELKKTWGFEFEAKSQKVGQITQTYELDAENPRDRAALSNPKVVKMMADLAAFSRSTAPMPESGIAQEGTGQTPGQIAMEKMKANPNWQQDATLRSQITALFTQEAARKRQANR